MRDNGTEKNSGSGIRGGKFLSAFCSFVGTVCVILIILLCIPVTIPGFAGFEIFNVVSGSMEPAIPVGSIVYSKPEDCAKLESGDVICFNMNGMTVTHRIVENDIEKKEIITKGDNNDQADPTPVRYGSVIGKVRLHIPFMGGFFEFFTDLKGKIYLMGILAAGFVLMMVGASLREKSDKKKGKNADE